MTPPVQRGAPVAAALRSVCHALLAATAACMVMASAHALQGTLVADPQAAAVRKVIEALIAADEAQDVDRVLSFYAPDARLVTPSGPNVVGLAAIGEHYRELFAQGSLSIEMRIDDIVVSADLAVARGVNDVFFTSADTGEVSRVRSKFLMTLRRETRHGWLITNLMWSNETLPVGSRPQGQSVPARRTEERKRENANESRKNRGQGHLARSTPGAAGPGESLRQETGRTVPRNSVPALGPGR